MKKIDDNLLAISNAMLKNKSDWSYVTEDQKEKFFFIFNRLFAKKLLSYSYMLNNAANKAYAMDLWFAYFKNKPYPSWIWSKKAKTEKSDFTKEEIKQLIEYFNIDTFNLNYLVENNKDLLKEELKQIKKIKDNGKKYR